MKKETIKLLNDIIKFDCDYDWKELVISRQGFDLLVDYLRYLQEKVCKYEKEYVYLYGESE